MRLTTITFVPGRRDPSVRSPHEKDGPRPRFVDTHDYTHEDDPSRSDQAGPHRHGHVAHVQGGRRTVVVVIATRPAVSTIGLAGHRLESFH